MAWLSGIDTLGCGHVWMRPGLKSDGTKYYDYVLYHVDDLLVVSETPKGSHGRVGSHIHCVSWIGLRDEGLSRSQVLEIQVGILGESGEDSVESVG
jgi:hypothetical protein